ncbi:MAG TPA: multicopper oxidase domain-containing protein [Pyrinomonadaceae bacterium]|nr:multicopper oxidase domain-containing protein [Pyrinomonadaceae bacterium]
MITRRDALKLSLAAAGSGLIGVDRAMAQSKEVLKNLCYPEDSQPIVPISSPPSRPFVAPLNIMPVKQPVPKLDPPPDPNAHQRYEEFLPKKFYEIRETEFQWVYHPDAPYSTGGGSWSWGFDGITPGPTYHARYGEPILVRMFNMLPPLNEKNVTFGTPITTTHLHNAHTASESDGYPMDQVKSGEFWDHHYACFPASMDEHEKLTTLWYHDHMMGATAANVYAGLSGFFLLFDDKDSGNENDPNPEAWRLPSGKYDIPLVLHDVLFDSNGQAFFNPFNTDGILGDKFTVNRIIQPYLQVEARKYRFRILNGGPSRFYQLFLSSGQPFVVVTGDGNFLPKPVKAESVYLSVAQRADVIIDFARYQPGDQVILQNRLEQVNGKGPSGRTLTPGDGIMRFDIVASPNPDNSRIPDHFRDLPKIPEDLSKFKHRVWVFDYMGGTWTVNGKIFGHGHRIDAEIEQGSGEVWILRNQGKNWSHPIHSHFTEFLLREVNGRLIQPNTIQSTEFRRHYEFESSDAPIKVFMGGQRRDIATLLPNDELKVFMRWNDFLGKYVMHCHNVVHEDHDMMIRWDIVPKKPVGGAPQRSLPTASPKGKIRNP